MARGPAPQPTALKLLRGNPGRRRLNDAEATPEVPLAVPAPPVALKGEASAEWRRRAPQLLRLGLMTEVDLPAFESYCRAWGRYVDAETKVEATGVILQAPSGYPIQNPMLAVANKALAQCKDFWARFGMTPSDRTRVRIDKGKGAAPQSKLDRFMQKRA